MTNLTALIESLVAAQNQPPPPPPPQATQPQQATVVSEITTTPISVAPNTTAAQHRMPPGYPWGILESYTPEGYNLTPQIAQSGQQVMAFAPPVVHVASAVSNEICNAVPPVMNIVPVVNDVVIQWEN